MSDTRKRAKQKIVVSGNTALVAQQKSTINPPWDPAPYNVEQVNGREIVLSRGHRTKRRDINDIKILKIRPNMPTLPQQHPM